MVHGEKIISRSNRIRFSAAVLSVLESLEQRRLLSAASHDVGALALGAVPSSATTVPLQPPETGGVNVRIDPNAKSTTGIRRGPTTGARGRNGGSIEHDVIVVQPDLPNTQSQQFAHLDGIGSGLDIELEKSTALQANTAASAAFDKAAAYVESLFDDPITVVIDADFSSLGPGILGETVPVAALWDYDATRTLMVNDASGDESIVAQIPTASNVVFTVNDTSFSVSSDMLVNRANLLALGVSAATLSGSGFPNSEYNPSVKKDAKIAFNSDVTFDFDPSNGISSGSEDFVGTAVHEMLHTLGFGSEVDYVDGALDDSRSRVLNATPLDLFRMRPGDGHANFGGRNRVLCTGSIISRQVVYDGGVWDPTGITTISGLTDGDVPVATGTNHGDGYQASHWKDDSLINNIVIGSMDPVAPASGVVEVRNEDRRAMGLIGWDVSSSGAILQEDGSLTINGTSGADTVTVGVNGGIVTATIDGVNGFFNSASAASIDVDAMAGNDYITGSSRKDSLIGGLGNDTILGGSEDDTLVGADGDDRLEGGSDQDFLSGGNGNDTMIGGSSGDIFTGGSNTDTADYSDSAVNLVITAQDNVANDGASGEGDNVESDVENVVGGGGDDVIYGNTSGNILIGGTGNDYLDGKDGNDTLNGAGGNDTLVGSSGTDSMTGDAGNDIFYMADAVGNHDTAWGGSGTDSVGSSDSDDTFFQ